MSNQDNFPLGTDDDMDKLLKFDPLHEAEKVTGESYKDDHHTEALGFLLAMSHNQNKKDVLVANGDTHYSSTFEESCSLLENLGFELVYEKDFEGRTYGDESPPSETERIYYHKSGMIVFTESYSGTGRNNAIMYFNLDVDQESRNWVKLCYSGGFTDDILCASIDVREGMRHTINQVLNSGKLVQPINVERTYLHFSNYMDHEKANGLRNYKSMTESKIEQLPEHVRRDFFGQ